MWSQRVIGGGAAISLVEANRQFQHLEIAYGLILAVECCAHIWFLTKFQVSTCDLRARCLMGCDEPPGADGGR